MIFRRKRTYKIEGDFSVREKRLTGLQVLMKVLNFLLITVTLTLCYYLVFALIFDTDVEKEMKEENRAYEQIYDDVLRKLGRLEDVTAGLESKEEIPFHAGSGPFRFQRVNRLRAAEQKTANRQILLIFADQAVWEHRCAASCTLR